MVVFNESIQFEWDVANRDKNRVKHNVTMEEAESTFFDSDRIIYKDVFHSKKEDRHILIGKTKDNRLLYTVFTFRNSKIRVISTRDINKKEVYLYEKKT